MKQESSLPLQRDNDVKDGCIDVAADEAAPSAAALGALLEDDEPVEADAEGRVRRLAERLARLDAANVAGMLAAASHGHPQGRGPRLAARLDAALAAAAALAARRARAAAAARAEPADAAQARPAAAQADAAARRLLRHLRDLLDWLDAPPLRDLDATPELPLAGEEGRARALAAATALRAALRRADAEPAARRLAAVRERLRRLARARDQLAAALARHLNNALVHLGNEAQAAAATGPPGRAPPPPPPPPPPPAARRHHAELAPFAPFMRWLKDMDERAYDGLAKLYASTWARVYEREVKAAGEAARAELAQAPPDRVDPIFDGVLGLVETICDAEQEFCTQFFHLDVDVKSDGSDGERSERSEAGERERRAGAESRRFMGELFPTLEADLLALVAHIEKHDPYGAMRALACAGRRALAGGGSSGGAEGGEASWARWGVAAAAVGAKRACDRAVAARLAALAAARGRGLPQAVRDFEELAAAAEDVFRGGRRADLDRWYLALGAALTRAVAAAPPAGAQRLQSAHRLHAALSALRAPALDALRRETRALYNEALRSYVAHHLPRPLEKLTQFFESVSEAVAAGAREDEVCYRAALSKHELRRLLALYPAHEVRKSLHRLYRTVEKQLSEDSGLLQVVWRHMQEEFISQHLALQARIAACYPGAGLSLPLTTQDILDAFSDIAREH